MYTSSDPPFALGYLVIIGSNNAEPVVSTNVDEELDGMDWDEVGKRCRECDVRVSCMVMGEQDGKLRSLVEAVRCNLLDIAKSQSPGGLDELWFDPPPDTQVYLSGLSIDPGEGPGLSFAKSSGTVPPSPARQPVETPIDPAAQQAKFLAMQNQANMLRYIQAQVRAGQNGAGLSAQVMQNLLAAASNGNIDMNNPAMQQIKSLVTLQQQQRQGQVALNPAAAVAAAAAAMNTLVQQQQQQQQQQKQDAQRSNSTGQKAWTGDIVWPVSGTGVQTLSRFKIPSFDVPHSCWSR
jgi:uncharacterized membrane protein YkoI